MNNVIDESKVPNPLESDQDVLLAIRGYFEWNEEMLPEPARSLNGLRNMCLYIQDHILDKEPLADGLQGRLFESLNKVSPLIPEKLSSNPRLQYASEYVLNTTLSEWGRLDYNLKYLFMTNYIKMLYFENYSEVKGPLYSILKHEVANPLQSKFIAFFKISKDNSEEVNKYWNFNKERYKPNLPIETILMLRQIDFYHFVAQGLAQGFGLEMIERIDHFLVSPESGGFYSSLILPDKSARIQIKDLKWLNTPQGEVYTQLNEPKDYEKAFDMFAELPEGSM